MEGSNRRPVQEIILSHIRSNASSHASYDDWSSEKIRASPGMLAHQRSLAVSKCVTRKVFQNLEDASISVQLIRFDPRHSHGNQLQSWSTRFELLLAPK